MPISINNQPKEANHMKSKILLCITCLSLMILVAGAFAEGTDNQAQAGNGYTIGAGDILSITTWKEEDFSLEEVLVRLDGKISFPLLDDILAAGLTPVELKTEISKRLADFVEAPNVTVQVRDPRSQKFYVLGEVMETGEYPMVKKLTVLQAFALAGGFTEWAQKDEIILIRRENGQDKIIRVNYKKIVKGKDLDKNLLIQADDTIIVP